MYVITLSTLLLLASASGAEPTPPEVYEPVLQHIYEQHPDRPLILFSTVVKIECIRGGCAEPWARDLPNEWLARAHARNMISDYCKYRSGACVRANGEVVLTSSLSVLWVMLSTGRSCGAGCVEVFGHFVEPSGERSARQWWTLYTLRSHEGSWVVQKAERSGFGYLDG